MLGNTTIAMPLRDTLLPLLLAVAILPAARGERPPPGTIRFERDVAPILRTHCITCHTGRDAKGGFDLSTAESAFQPGDDGNRIVKGKSQSSPLVKRLVDGSMPPRNHLPRPTRQEIALVKRWVDQGASWPAQVKVDRFDVTTDRWAGRDWWSLQPLTRPTPPPPCPDHADCAPVASPIDLFIRQRLAASHLKPSPPASRRQFLRRVTFDLIGLPPTPEQTQQFLHDNRPDADARLVDRLLASPHYGERWGRHWLDVIGFTESDGFEHDKFRPHSWPYRDYVVRSLNADLPYNEFVRQQIAGDVLSNATRQSIAATGFLVSGEWDEVQKVGASKSEMRRAREEELAEMIQTVSGTFLGLTVGCCRCHDHKFDPLPQADYYRIRAVFDGVEHSQGSQPGNRPLATARETATLQAKKTPLLKQRKTLLEQAARLTQQLPGDAILKPGSSARQSLVEGRHGRALNAAHTTASLPSRPAFHKPPLTVECWALARTRAKFNVFVANNLKSSGEHWELYSFKDKGDFSVYMPGYSPNTIRSEAIITDGKWHYLAMQFDGQEVRMFVDGKEVQRQKLKRVGKPGPLGTLDLGGYVPGKVGCDGAVDDVRISNILRPITEPTPAPFQSDQHTVGLWNLDAVTAGRFTDQSAGSKTDSVRRTKRKLAEVEEAGRRVDMQLADLEPPRGYIGFRRKPGQTHLLLRGDPTKPGTPVLPRGLSALGTHDGDLGLAADASEAERRRRFADWVANRDNPLTARVIANRVWQFHMGAGMVTNASDLGFNGGLPSHPDLLDWLASQLIDSGWSLKHLHRQIVLSATYGQSSRSRPAAFEADAENRLLWRFQPRRLEAEVIRDSMLAASGELNTTMRGPSVKPFTVTVFNTHFYHLFDSAEARYNRRTIYRANVITGRDPLLDCFDCPSPSVATPRRRSTVTPSQALALMNNAFVLRQGRKMAERVAAEVGRNTEAQARRGFQLSITRDPGDRELQQVATLIRDHGLEYACWALLNSSEFLYLP